MSLQQYYSARANEYEKVYDKPERQADLRVLHTVVPEYFIGRHVLDVACGTGYWTRRIATRAATVVGCDISPEVLTVARAKHPASLPADYVLCDAFALHRVATRVDAALVGFWWSHILRSDLPRFLTGLHGRLPVGSRVMIVDNRYVAGSNWPLSRTDSEGNTFQRRILEDGTEYEVLKNFSSPDEIREAIMSAGGSEPDIRELPYYWYSTHEVRRAAFNGASRV